MVERRLNRLRARRLSRRRRRLRKLIAIDKQAVAGYALLGVCEYKTGDYDGALEHLDTAHTLGLPPEHPLGSAATYYLALLLNRHGQHDAAAGLLLSAPEKKAAASSVLLAIGLTGLRIAKLPEELAPAEKDLALEVGRGLAAPEADALAAMRALLAASPGSTESALPLRHGAAARRHVRRIPAVRAGTARDPRHVPSLLALVRELERQSQFAQALPYPSRP
jgi:tetratricopeptide (TPR) repeat protein